MVKNKAIKETAKLHYDNLEKSFLKTLGLTFLQVMYKSIDEAKESTLIVHKVDGETVGFVTGTTDMREVFKIMVFRHPVKLFLSLLPSVFSFKKIKKIFEIIFYEKKVIKCSIELPEAELLSIAVDKNFRGKKIADKLYEDLCQHFMNKNIDSFKIIVGSELIPAQKFYEKMGAERVGEIEVHKGEKSYIYLQKL